MLNLQIERASYRAASLDDVPYLAEHMRKTDCVEIAATALLKPEEALRYSIENSWESWVAIYDGKPEIAWGVVDGYALTGTGFIWLLGTEKLERLPFLWLPQCGPTCRHMLTRYSRLLNYVDARNTKTLRWLKWLGFKMGEPLEYGPLRRMFVPIEMDRERCASRFSE